MNNQKKKPEREKGAAPPDYMPAIFGWISMEAQREQAREIVDFTDEINQLKGGENMNFNELQFSNLSEEELNKIQQLEKELNQNRKEKIILLALSKQEKNN